MGLSGFSYGEWETMIIFGESKEAAHRKSIVNATTTFDLRQLKNIIKGTQFSDVRHVAEQRFLELKGMSRKQRKEREQIHKNQEEAKKNRIEEFRKSAENKERPEYWLKKLYENYVVENSFGREQIEEGLMSYGNAVYPHIRVYVFSLAEQFHEFTGKIRGIRYSTAEGKQTGAIIDKYSSGLGCSICFIAKFNHPDRVEDIEKFYKYIKNKVYSHSEIGFCDIFNAVKIRQETVRAMGMASCDHKETATFYTEILQDPSCFVRWEAIDILKEQWTPAEIQNNVDLCQELSKTYYTHPFLSSRIAHYHMFFNFRHPQQPQDM